MHVSHDNGVNGGKQIQIWCLLRIELFNVTHQVTLPNCSRCEVCLLSSIACF